MNSNIGLRRRRLSEFPAPTREHHRLFCRNEDWTLVVDATGKPVGHHETYELELDNGVTLRTRISNPVNRTGYAPGLWAHILRDQLDVTPAVFWACTQNKVRPIRSTVGVSPGTKSLPLYLISQLTSLLGLSAEEAIEFTVGRAKEMIAEYWQNRTG